MKKLYTNEKGSALLIALSLLAMMTLVGIGIVNYAGTDVELSYNETNGEKAFYIAEAGAKRAMMEIKNDMSWRTGFNNVSFAGGSFTVNVVDSTIDSTLLDTMLVRSAGTVNQANARIELALIPRLLYPFAYGLFADAGIFMDKNTCTDSYNSDSGTYAATVDDSAGNIGSNGTIGTSKDVTIGGDVSVATPDGITLGVNNTITGDTTTAADSVDLDIVPDSEYEWAKANSRAQIGMSGSNYSYNNGNKTLTIGTSGNVVMTSGVYYFSSITAGQLSSISINPGDNVTIYVAGDIIMNQGSTFNQGGKPLDCIIYSKGANLQFNQDNIFVGSFYGPNAHIQYDQTTQAYGSLVGNSIQLDMGACFHYDRYLSSFIRKSVDSTDVVAWGEVY